MADGSRRSLITKKDFLNMPFQKTMIVAALALGTALTAVPASAQQGAPGYSTEGAVVAVPRVKQQHQVRTRTFNAVPQYQESQYSGISGYAPDGSVIDIR
jgi:hypothetical protein